MRHPSLITAFNAGAVVFLLPPPALAEVSDKIETIPEHWAMGLLLGLLGFVAWRWRKWAGIVFLLVSLPFATVGIAIIADSHVGPAALSEQGWPYAAAAIGRLVLAWAGLAAGALLHRRLARRLGHAA